MPAQSVDIQVVRGRYQLLEQLGEGSMGRVFRAYDRLSGETVALKRVSGPFTIEPHLSSTVDDLPNTEPQVALAREFQSLASLRHPNIIGVRDYGFADGAPYFTMEFLEDAQNLLEAGRHRSLGDKIGLLVQMLQALVYLHRRDIVHRDLKPGNVLLAAERVRVLDFGLSVRTSEARGTVGTLNYMAPEVLYGQPAGPASDFYAVGVLAYQLLVGEHPFHRRPPGGSLIKRILTEEPDLGRPEIPPPLRPILGRLLAKQPAERFPRAADVIAAFSAATGVAYPPETEATRESLLQAASFVGRDRELGMLKRSLRQALDGHGEAWLIGGESGVGKSRLLDELRIHALVRGALVLRSQATRGGRPYRLWRPILRRLLLETEVNNLEASVLKAVVPDLDELIERPVADAPPLKPQATQARLLTALSNLIVRRSRRRPVVLIVEDLHWASGESLDLLRELASDVAALPLLLVGDYRDDERPELAEELRGLRHLKLGRLPRRAIRELSESMIGPAGRRQSVLNLLQRETEGNPLFLIEVVRALAEEAGELERIGSTTLPKSVFTGGLQRLVERRLSRVPAEAVAALQTSAVAGRQINLPMLREAYPDLDVDLWITTCANVAVLTTADERWGFAHQRLRDGVLAQLNEAQLRQVHAQVAAALERAYPEPAEQADSLAYHWYQSGERPEKVVAFGQKAGDRALSLGAYSDARRQYERVVESLERMAPSPEHQALLIDIILKLARMAAFLPGENIPHLLQRALEVAETLGDRPRQASVLGSIGAYHYVGGRMPQAFAYFGRSMALADELGLEHLLLLPLNLIGRALCAIGRYREGADLLARGIELAERFGDRELLAGSLAFYASSFWLQGDPEAGAPHAARAMALAEELGHPSRIAANCMTLGFFYAFSGRFDEATDYLERCLAIVDETQDLHPLYTAHGCLGYVHLQRGDYPLAAHHLDQCLRLAGESAQLTTHLPMYQAFQAELWWREGRTDEALALAESALRLAEETRQPMAQGLVRQSLAWLHLNPPDPAPDRALALLNEGLSLYEAENARPFAAVCSWQLARTHHALGDHAAAQRLLSQAQAEFEALGMTWHRRQAGNLALPAD